MLTQSHQISETKQVERPPKKSRVLTLRQAMGNYLRTSLALKTLPEFVSKTNPSLPWYQVLDNWRHFQATFSPAEWSSISQVQQHFPPQQSFTSLPHYLMKKLLVATAPAGRWCSGQQFHWDEWSWPPGKTRQKIVSTQSLGQSVKQNRM